MDLCPEVLLKFWEQEGFGSYHNGLLWSSNPDYLKNCLIDINLENDVVVFLRTSLLNFYVYSKKVDTFFNINLRSGWINDVGNDFDIFMMITLLDDEYLRDGIDIIMHEKANKNLGMLDSRSCYGYEPILSLGGEENVQNLRKLSMPEHVSILAQTL